MTSSGNALTLRCPSAEPPCDTPLNAGRPDGRGLVPQEEVNPIRALATIALLATLLVACTTKASAASKVTQLRSEIRGHVRDVEQAKTTLRFFRNHSVLFYKWSTKQAAHTARAQARDRVRFGRQRLASLRSQLRRQLVPHFDQWVCIHGYEGAWNDPDPPYYGGLQMDLEFQATYGGDLLRRKGTADHWTLWEQMLVAERAYVSRGFNPWPQTARWCGLI